MFNKIADLARFWTVKAVTQISRRKYQVVLAPVSPLIRCPGCGCYRQPWHFEGGKHVCIVCANRAS